MNIAGFGSAVTEYRAAEATNAVSLSVLKLSMDSSEQVGNSMIQMMEQSINPAVGSNVDIRL